MDIFFISFRESNCEANWKRVLEYHRNAKRIHGITGIDKAHVTCNDLSSTDFFWTIDGDNYLIEKLQYENHISNDLLLFHAIDPLFEETTSLGGVKLWRKDSLIEKTMSKGDFTLNATANKKVINKPFSISNYNASPFDAWKTSFRHCVKLLSIIFRNRPNANNIDTYLSRWKNSCNSTASYSNWAYQGYLDAVKYVKEVDPDLNQLYKINEYDWLELYFKERYETS